MTDRHAHLETDAGTTRVDVPKLKAIVQNMIASLSRLNGTPSQPIVDDYLIYFRRARARLDRLNDSDTTELAQLSELAREIKEVSATFLLLMRQRNMVQQVVSLPVTRKDGNAPASNIHLN